MGQYVYVNIATKIIVAKNYESYVLRNQYYHYKDIKEKLEQQFNLDLFDCNQDENYVYYEIKEHILEECLYDFLYEQSQDLMYSEWIRKDLLKIKGKKGYEMLDMIKNDELDYIHYFEYSYLKEHYFIKDCCVYLEGICFLSEGKVYFECWNELFNYIHAQVRKASLNILKDTVYLELV